MDRHDREELIDRPAVGQRLEEREVAEVPVDERRVEIGDDVLELVAALSHDRLRQHVHGREVDLLRERALAQREHAAVEQLLRALLVERDDRGRSRAPAASRRSCATRRGSRPSSRAAADGRPRVSSGTGRSPCDSTSITLISSSAWCAVSARPDSLMMCGIGSSCSRHASASV